MLDRSWSVLSFRDQPNPQHVEYANPSAIEPSLTQIRRAAPLVFAGRVDQLRDELAAAQTGDGFLVQAGDCAERFVDSEAGAVHRRLDTVRAVAGALAERSGQRVILAARMAGQYAKPRSNPWEVRDGVRLPSYFGDLYNDVAFSAEARRPDARRMLLGYQCAARTLCAALALHDACEPWQHRIARPDPVEGTAGALTWYTSHEGLNLDYEAAQTRRVAGYRGHYDLSGHLPWIGDRTRSPGGAHVEFFRGVRNPIGVKLGAAARGDELAELLGALNPGNEPGRLVLVTRLGVSRVEAVLPELVRGVERARARVLWVCDPMHGNTRHLASGYKTRRVADVLGELEATFAVHDRLGTRLGGVHLEVTGDDVTECVGLPTCRSEHEVGLDYRSACDPRLSGAQSRLVARRVADWLRASRSSGAVAVNAAGG
ncbi:MAG TPA: 3-deoxy-7-phosphoheptulonate synthase [Kofleriaceae bacterium]|jgi:3-deoxy-7-phosphoheptulonate synthase|nr:3-deoxy-7-phosphoheptulonate synthase [Kofleriaceae bacterium]